MAFLTGLQSDLIREAFDNLHAASGPDELRSFCFFAQRRSDLAPPGGAGPREVAARSLEQMGLVTWAGREFESAERAVYTPTEQGIDEALRLGVISIADVTALSAASKRAELRSKGGV